MMLIICSLIKIITTQKGIFLFTQTPYLYNYIRKISLYLGDNLKSATKHMYYQMHLHTNDHIYNYTQ